MSKLELDFDSLTLDEVEIIEEHTGKDITDLVSMDVITAKVAKVLVWIARRRNEPELTIDQCGGMTLGELTDFLGVGSDPKE